MGTHIKDTGDYALDALNPYDYPEDARENYFGPDWATSPRADAEQHEVESEDDLDDDGDWNIG